jgi:hypothetical protein
MSGKIAPLNLFERRGYRTHPSSSATANSNFTRLEPATNAALGWIDTESIAEDRRQVFLKISAQFRRINRGLSPGPG